MSCEVRSLVNDYSDGQLISRIHFPCFPTRLYPNQEALIRITHISFSTSGGAGRVARDLEKWQISRGLDARTIHLTHTDLRRDFARLPMTSFAAFLDDRLVRKPEFKNMVSLVREAVARPSSARILAQVKDSEIVHLHWALGLVSPAAVENILDQGIPVVWTLHDFRPFTGGCHFPGECQGYTAGCKSCPAVRSIFHQSVAKSAESWIQAFSGRSPHFVAPSLWILTAFQKSLLGQRSVSSLINNPGNVAGLNGSSDPDLRGRGYFLVVCSKLDDPRKKVRSIIKTWETASIKDNFRLFLIGDGSENLGKLPLGVHSVGFLDEKGLQRMYHGAAAVISGSLDDNSPLALIDSLRAGTPIICRTGGGAGELVEAGLNGFTFKNEEELAIILDSWPTQSRHLSPVQIVSSSQKFDISNVGQKYLELYDKLLGGKDNEKNGDKPV